MLKTIVVDDDSDNEKSSKKKKGGAEPSTKKSGKQNAHKKNLFFWATKIWEQILCTVQTVWQC
eukprot:15111892-Ditylum_brightwellii.AAC.1